MSTIVLVHGAFRGGWAWDRVVPLLDGHDVHAPTLLIDEAASLATWARQVADLLEDLQDVVLVGHSQGGLVALAAAELCPDRIGRIVLIDSAVPAPGQSAFDALPADVRARVTPDPEAWLEPVPVSGPDWEPALADWVNEHLVPAPARPGYEIVVPDPSAATGIPRTLVFCDRTPAYFPSGYARARLEAEGAEFTVLDVGHDAPLTHPHQVADIVLTAAGRAPGH